MDNYEIFVTQTVVSIVSVCLVCKFSNLVICPARVGRKNPQKLTHLSPQISSKTSRGKRQHEKTHQKHYQRQATARFAFCSYFIRFALLFLVCPLNHKGECWSTANKFKPPSPPPPDFFLFLAVPMRPNAALLF